MVVRKFDIQRDYEDVCGWWSQQKWPPIPQGILSPNGFLVENGENKLACAWLFKTDCPIAIMEWLVANPNTKWEDRDSAQYMLIEYISEYAKRDGSKFLFTMVKHPRLIERLNVCEFDKTDENMSHFLRSL